MIILLWVAGSVLIALLLLFTAYASTVGGIGVLSGYRYQRCPRCGRHGLVRGMVLHDQVCPVSASDRVADLVHGGVHLRHH